MQKRIGMLLLAIFSGWLGTASVYGETPAVTDGLSAYYSFDAVDEDGIWEDGSVNGLNAVTALGDNDANEDELPDIRIDTEDFVRGGASVRFDTDPELKEDYIAVCDGVNGWNPEGCEIAEDKDLIPTNGFTVAAWLKVEEVGQDQSIWQSRATGGGFIHTQVQGNGGIRMRLRGDSNQDNIVQFNELPGGEPIEFDEWFHWAGTYQKEAGSDEPGEWTVYINGEDVAGGTANGDVAGTELEVLGDWQQGAFIGLVPDFNRQYVGRMDEFYLFNRGITPEEVLLVMNGVAILPGDFNEDGVLDIVDLDDLTGQSASLANLKDYDLNDDDLVDDADIGIWVKDLFGSWIGDANLDGEFDSGDLVVVLASGAYEADVDSVWSTGDFNGNGRTDSGDLVAALSDGGYEAGPVVAPAAVPEPSSVVLMLLGVVTWTLRSRNRQ